MMIKRYLLQILILFLILSSGCQNSKKNLEVNINGFTATQGSTINVDGGEVIYLIAPETDKETVKIDFEGNGKFELEKSGNIVEFRHTYKEGTYNPKIKYDDNEFSLTLNVAIKTVIPEESKKPVEKAVTPSIKKSPLPKKGEILENWTGYGDGKYEMLLTDLPVKINWTFTMKDISMELYDDNTFEGHGKVLIKDKKVMEIDLKKGGNMPFYWTNTEYDFTFTGKKQNNTYILEKFPLVYGIIEAKGSSLKSSEYNPPLIFTGSPIKGENMGNAIEFSHDENGPPPENVKEIKGDIYIRLELK